jgi:LemA protein
MKKSFVVLIGVFAFILLVAVILLLSSIRFRNNMVTYDEDVSKAWAQVENVYQRRADLIPNLVNTVKGYADFEKSTLTAVIEARAKATSVNISADKLNAQTMAQFQQAQDGLGSALSKLMVVVEKYPDLKANQNFLELQAQLEGTENRIANERMKFNETTRTYNVYIRRFPASIFAGIYGFVEKPYFKATEGAEKAPEVKF